MRDQQSDELKKRVVEWLENQGYPLEFLTAAAFEHEHFDVRPSQYEPDPQTGVPREVDVLAMLTMDRSTSSNGPRFIRIEYAVECKYTRDKPWVAFASKGTQMAPSARITQTLASPLGEAIMWTLAGDAELQELDTFHAPERPAFGGRQVFGKEQDAFYSTVQSIVSAARAVADSYNEEPDDPLSASLRFGVIVLPLIVIEGELFESWLDTGTGKIVVEKNSHLRLHWRGSEYHPPVATVDVVTAEYLPKFVELRRRESSLLLRRMFECAEQIDRCALQRTLRGLSITSGARGIRGLPPLLQRIKAEGDEGVQLVD